MVLVDVGVETLTFAFVIGSNVNLPLHNNYLPLNNNLPLKIASKLNCL
jgi:hypothetical protein